VKTLVRGASLVLPDQSEPVPGDILVVDGRIAAITEPSTRIPPDIDEDIDASGLLAFPGFIDPHVHTRDPGQTHKEDLEHVTRAAAAGGVTTLFEMPNTLPGVVTPDIARERAVDHQNRSWVDFGLWGLARGDEDAAQLSMLADEGVVACKLFWGYGFDSRTGALVYDAEDHSPEITAPVDAGGLLQLFAAAAEAGMLLGIHCEDRGVLARSAKAVGSLRDYGDLLRARPEAAETVAIAQVIEASRVTRARAHVVHVSTARGMALIRTAQRDGIMITAETCPHYLTLAAEDYASLGSSMKVYPPVQPRSNQEALWAALRDGTVASIGSDHAPHSLEERTGDFTSQPAGAVGVETMTRVLLDASLRGRLSLGRLSWLLGEGTARLYGVYPRKGVLRAGADADITLVDPTRAWRITNESLHSKTRLSPWHGQTGLGTPVRTVVRGMTVALDGEPVSEPRGRFVSATGGSSSQSS
jgi:allantoinase